MGLIRVKSPSAPFPMYFTQCNPHYFSNTAQSTALNSLNPIHPLNLNHQTQLTQPNPTYTPHIPNPAHQTHSPSRPIPNHQTQLTQPSLPNSTQPIQLTKPNPQSPTSPNQLNQCNPSSLPNQTCKTQPNSQN